MLGVPPHRVACALGVHDGGCVGTVGDRCAIGVIEVFARMEIACMPTVDHQGGRPGPEIVDVLMKSIEVVRDGGSRERVSRDVFELEEPAAEPFLCAA